MGRGDKMKKRQVQVENVINFQPPSSPNYVKRQRPEDCKPHEPDFVRELTKMELIEKNVQNSSEGDGPTRQALFNGLILQNVFANFETDYLLYSCSLVNKTWNAEARTFVRARRNCVAKNNRKTSPCAFLQKLDLLCGQMRQSGRVIPFNYLKLDFSKRCAKTSGAHGHPYSNVLSQVKLKGLTISGSVFPDCDHHKPLLTLLKHQTRELRSLRVESTGPFGRFLTDDWFPQLGQLEELSIEDLHCSDMPSVELRRLQWLLHDCPNLTKILPGALNQLKIVPETILARVTIHGSLTIVKKPDAKDLAFLCIIADKVSGLKELRFYETPPNDFEEDNGDHWGENSSKAKTYNTALERLLHTAQQSLESTTTNAGYPKAKLVLTLRDEHDWNDTAAINFERTMPRLKEVGITVETETFYDCEDVLYGSQTVRELNLVLKNDEFNLELLSTLFPNLSVLNLLLKDHFPRIMLWERRQQWFRAPISEVCRNWPGLEELKILGPPACVNRNYDAYFCGISQEEEKRLRKQDDDYLQKVEIVPCRSCLLTMPSLRLFSFGKDVHFATRKDRPNVPKGFASRVTQFLLFNRCPQLKVRLFMEGQLRGKSN